MNEQQRRQAEQLLRKVARFGQRVLDELAEQEAAEMRKIESGRSRVKASTGAAESPVRTQKREHCKKEEV